MTENQSFDHHFFGNLIRAAFHHHDAIFHARNREIQPAVLQFGVSRIQVIAAFNQADTYCCDRLIERNA